MMTRTVLSIFAFLSLLALIAKPVWDSRAQWHLGQSYDDGIYWVSAKSLASGEGYRVVSLPGQPYAVKYPPLYPLYLSLAWRLQPAFPQNLPIAAALQAMLLPVYLALLLVFFRQSGFSWRRTLLVAAMTIVSFNVVLLTITLLSELLFGCFLLGAILVIERSVVSTDRTSQWWALAGGLLTGLAYLTRNAAFPLFVAVPIFFVLRKRFSLSLFFFALALPIAAAWHLWTFTHYGSGADPSNINYFQEYIRVIRANGFWSNVTRQFPTLSASVAENFFSGINGLLRGLPLQHTVLAAAIAGGIRLGRRREWPLFLIFTALYLGMLVCWWFDGLTRLVVPVWPFLLAGIAEEASHFGSLCQQSVMRSHFWSKHTYVLKSAPHWILVLAGICIVIRNDQATWGRISSVLAEEHELRINDQQAFSWITEHAKSNDLVLTSKDAVTFLYTGVPASRALFLAVTSRKTERNPLAGSFYSLPVGYERGLLLIMRSDFADHQLDWFRVRAESIVGSHLEHSSQAALIFSVPLKP
jgi:hypothetical protein